MPSLTPPSKERIHHAICHGSVRTERKLKTLLRKLLHSLRSSRSAYTYQFKAHRLAHIRGQLALLRDEECNAQHELNDAKIHWQSLQ